MHSGPGIAFYVTRYCADMVKPQKRRLADCFAEHITLCVRSPGDNKAKFKAAIWPASQPARAGQPAGYWGDSVSPGKFSPTLQVKSLLHKLPELPRGGVHVHGSDGHCNQNLSAGSKSTRGTVLCNCKQWALKCSQSGLIAGSKR